MLWKYRNYDSDLAKKLAFGLDKPIKIGDFLAGRGFKDVNEVRRFLAIDLKELSSPETMPGMDKAVEILLKAHLDNKIIVISGDYDADGLTATALLKRVLEPLGFKVLTRIPHRLEEGYGLTQAAVNEMASWGANLIITVDCGVSDYEAIALANQLGLSVIITDHHELPPKLPEAAAIVNPHLGGGWETYPLAGVGVAFMLAWAVRKAFLERKLVSSAPSMVENLSLVALGTIADMAPLVGVNRTLVSHGLNFLSATQWPGLVALKKNLRLNNHSRLTVRDVGFKLAPRLNAAGRLGSSAPALGILTTSDQVEALDLARQLDELNRQRYETQARLVEEALEMLEHEVVSSSLSVILAKEGWPRGVLGLAASRVAEKSGKPTIMFTIENDVAIGSGRTARGFNLFEILTEVRDICVSMGGHSQAAGLKVNLDRLEEFREAFENAASHQSGADTENETELLIDLTCKLSELSLLADHFSEFEPFGQAHPSPVAVIKNIKVLDSVVKGQKLSLRVSDGFSRQHLSGFNLISRVDEVGPIMHLAVVYEPDSASSDKWCLVDFINPFQESLIEDEPPF
ncbi:MAG: single-stranded-DNA-specific exonuclease RecJ [Deltaproteobacteria bacterium]|jgi:single-stranded-DNA-specific exonuclease|nr:single-stranded-DNA-specific exonuclease RecJ [Deltaproteobacteria bacterium]